MALSSPFLDSIGGGYFSTRVSTLLKISRGGYYLTCQGVHDPSFEADVQKIPVLENLEFRVVSVATRRTEHGMIFPVIKIRLMTRIILTPAQNYPQLQVGSFIHVSPRVFNSKYQSQYGDYTFLDKEVELDTKVIERTFD
jgi:hypothetical protein